MDSPSSGLLTTVGRPRTSLGPDMNVAGCLSLLGSNCQSTIPRHIVGQRSLVDVDIVQVGDLELSPTGRK